jgi:hypothetical protein
MKKLSLLSVLFLVVLPFSLIAQIKVNSSGYVGINNTNPTYRLDVVGNVKFSNGSQSLAWDGTTLGPTTNGMSLGGNLVRWSNFFTINGYFTYAPVTTSDLNFKTNIVNLAGMKDKLALLRAVSYQFKTDVPGLAIDKTNNSTQFGFIAQELKEIFPDMVKQMDNGMLGISYTELIPVLVQALKEQQVEIEELKTRVVSLEKNIK